MEKEEKLNKALLVSLVLNDSFDYEASFRELEELCRTDSIEVVAKIMQNKSAPDVRTFIGKGKIEEAKSICENNDINMVIFDCELSPSQIRNIEEDIGNVDVLDRSMLILDIFASHAQSNEGKIQVELAQLSYTVPRLQGKGKNLSRLGGGIGTRGPGETKLETDRRHIEHRKQKLENELKEIEKNRYTQRIQREKSNIFKVAICGYTNAGKSTLLNYLTDANILSENKLFATLDTTTRKFNLLDTQDILLTDTVGFIRNLPHHLIKSFKSTFEEIKFNDAIIVLIDSTDASYEEHVQITKGLLDEIGASNKPTLYVYNKCDLLDTIPVNDPTSNHLFISSVSGFGIDLLLKKIEEIIMSSKKQVTIELPNSKLGLLNNLYSTSKVLSVEYGNESATIEAILDIKTQGLFKDYIKE